ncbi:nitrilase-related carbon-nitrogen hydrolase [Peribacillus frigoritolerans]|nr:nitrilase-related carbon-nitrogen hydrolase [Peribacillus frigoritolerans]
MKNIILFQAILDILSDETAYGKIGVGICWDEWYPEVARILSLQGAEILFYPSAIGSEPDHPEISTRSSWEKAISAHGISNGVFVAATNRVGQEKDMNFLRRFIH